MSKLNTVEGFMDLKYLRRNADKCLRNALIASESEGMEEAKEDMVASLKSHVNQIVNYLKASIEAGNEVVTRFDLDQYN